MTAGLIFAGALVAGSAVPASAASSSALFTQIFPGTGVGPSVPIAVRRARADAQAQAEAAGFDPARCLEGTPEIDQVRPGQVIASLDLFC